MQRIVHPFSAKNHCCGCHSIPERAILVFRLPLGGIALLVLSSLFGCGGGGGAGGSTRTEISGTLQVTDFTIPAGQTRVVTADTIITASNNIQIDGTLQVSPGVSLAMLGSNQLTISKTGKIEPATQSRVAQQTSRASRDPQPPAIYVTAPLAVIDGDITLPPETDFLYAGVARVPFGAHLSVDGSITTTGEDAKGPGQLGKSSGNIELGTQKAITAVSNHYSGISGTFSRAVEASIKGTLTTGKGGNGWNDYSGSTSSTGDLLITGTRAGSAGDIAIDADAVDLSGAKLFAGDGGIGGDAGSKAPKTSPTTPRVLHAGDGSKTGDAGKNVTSVCGSGGNGGSVILPFKVTSPTGTAGKGGAAGDMACSAGNGGPGALGGDMNARIGIPGKNGTGPTNPSGKPAKARVWVPNGGNGGAAPDALTKGGNGGRLTLSTWDGTSFLVVDFVYLDNCHNGGAGYDGCALNPPSNGTDGGVGGALTRHGVNYITSSPIFTGGNGGGGCPAGFGGNAGLDDSNQEIGQRGKDGQACPNCGPPKFNAPVYFPAFPGDTYNYQVTVGGTTTPFTIHLLPMENVPGIPGPVVPFDQQKGTPPVEFKSYYKSDDTNGLQKFGTDTFIPPGGPPCETLRDAPAWQIPNGLGVGEFQNQSVIETDTKVGQSPQSNTFQVKTTYLDFGSLTVPAGKYDNVIHIRRDVSLNNGPVSQRDDWYAPNVGLIRSQSPADNSVTELVSYASSRAVYPGRAVLNAYAANKGGSASAQPVDSARKVRLNQAHKSK